MKSLKIVLATLVLTASIIGFSSFMSKSFNPNAFDSGCWEYAGSPNPPALESDIAFGGSVTNPAAFCNTGTLWCAICVDCGDNDITDWVVNDQPTAAFKHQLFIHRNDTKTAQGTIVFDLGDGCTATIYFFHIV